MTVQTTNVETDIALLIAFALIPWLWSGIAELGGPARGKVTRSFRCPLSGEPVTATFVADYPREVISCSAFTKPRHIRCTKACLRLEVGKRLFRVDRGGELDSTFRERSARKFSFATNSRPEMSSVGRSSDGTRCADFEHRRN